MSMVNISIKDISKNEELNMDELMNQVNKKYEEIKITEQVNYSLDNYIALEMEYEMNYTKSELLHIAKYYNISVRKKNKGELIQDIVIYEQEPNNSGEVQRRMYLWECLEQIKIDNYLSKFLNINI